MNEIIVYTKMKLFAEKRLHLAFDLKTEKAKNRNHIV